MCAFCHLGIILRARQNLPRQRPDRTRPCSLATPRSGSITKRGDMYLRMLLIQGAKSAVMNAHKHDDPISRWAHQLKEKSGWQKAVVALVNKNARILWAVFVRGKPLSRKN
jgi:transposase